jgi:hypothetical protein
VLTATMLHTPFKSNCQVPAKVLSRTK